MPRRPLFLARQGYRQRRLIDAARVLPAVGLVLFMAPVLGAGSGLDAALLIYLFTIWAVLIGLAAVLSHRLAAAPEDRSEKPARPEPASPGRDGAR